MTSTPNPNTKPPSKSCAKTSLAVASLLLFPTASFLSAATWDTPGSNNWKNNNNWAGNWPGNPGSSNDDAVFDTGTTNFTSPLIYNVGSNTNHVFLDTVNFTNTSGTGTSSYNIRSGNGKLLVMKSGGSITVDSAVTSDQRFSITLRPQDGNTTYTNDGTGTLRIDRMDAYWSPSILNASLLFNGTGEISVGGLNDRTATQTIQVTKRGSGTLTLDGNSNYTGETRLRDGGHIRVEHNDALGSTAGRTRVDGNNGNNGSVQFMGGLTVAEDFFLGGRQAADADASHLLNAAGDNTLTGEITTFTGGSRFNLQSDTGLLTVQGNIRETTSGADDLRLMGAGNALVTGDITNANVGSQGILRIYKTGNGTWSLNGTTDTRDPGGANGSVAVQNGTLSIGGTLYGDVTVNGGATLAGSGSIEGAVTISGIHSPGTSPGVQSITNLAYDPGSIVQWELTDNSAQTTIQGTVFVFDQIDISEDLDFAGPTTFDMDFATDSSVNWDDSFWDMDQSWLVYEVDGTTTNFDNLSLSIEDWEDGNGLLFDTVRPDGSFFLTLDGSNIFLNYASTTSIPEPSSVALLACLIPLAVLRRKRP